jgi:hypothetical protein
MRDVKSGSPVSIVTWLYNQKVSIGHLLCFPHNLISNPMGKGDCSLGGDTGPTIHHCRMPLPLASQIKTRIQTCIAARFDFMCWILKRLRPCTWADVKCIVAYVKERFISGIGMGSAIGAPGSPTGSSCL